MIQTELACIGCGYNLRGLAESGQCPECGALIGPSLRGDLLRFANPQWLEKLRFGTSLKLWNIGLTILAMIAATVLVAVGVPQFILGLVAFASSVLGLWASFAITTQEPRISMQEDPFTLRKVIRTCAGAAFVGNIISFVNDVIGAGLVLMIVSSLLLLGGIVSSFGELMYYGRFALRIPDPVLAKSTKNLMWLLPISFTLFFIIGFIATILGASPGITGPGAGTGPGPAIGVALGFAACFAGLLMLAATIWYVRLLTTYSRVFRTAAVEAQSRSIRPRGMSTINKVAVIGLDCAEPSLVFDRWVEHLPNLKRLMQSGTYGELTSCLPPITVPAWSCMAASKDPGTLGIYGFRNRADHSYDKLSIATSVTVKEPRIWDLLTETGKQSIVLGVPGTYPITKKIAGCMVTCFLTPDTSDPKITWTHPVELRTEINDWVGEYLRDVKGFRTDDKKWLLDQIYVMTKKRFTVARHLLTTRPWDLFWMVEMGVDRIHHGFWSCMDPSHHAYVAGNPFENAIFEYYKYVDQEIGKTLECIDLDNTVVWVVSDHGAKSMVGGCLFNQWLLNEDYLKFKEPPKPKQKFDYKDVDWSKTTAWGDGGYYGRLFLNVEGREPNGVVPKGRYERLRDELTARIEAIRDHRGQLMGNQCYKPGQIYDQVNGVAPDLVVIFGDLRWRSVGFVGSDSIYTFENDTGPDDANHAQQGMYIYTHPSLPAQRRTNGPTLYDVAPTILHQFGLAAPMGMKGSVLARSA